MNWLPEIQLGWLHAWIPALVFGILNAYFILRYPKYFRKRLFTIPPLPTLKGKVFTILAGIIFGRGLIIYSIFVPLEIGSFWFGFGLSIYLLGLAGYTLTMMNYAATPQNQPVIHGMYRLSRHPMQIMSAILWIGIGFMATSIELIIASVLLIGLSHYSFVAQESYCIKSYGQPYEDYLHHTPRYFGI